MKITKRQLRRIIREEAADCAKDYRLGTLSRQEYEDCLKRFEEPDDYSYRRFPPRKTTYVGADANQAKIAAVEKAIAVKPNNFLQSVLSQLQRGRGLSRKQNSIVKTILAKSDPEAASLFEQMRITRRQLRRIIQEVIAGSPTIGKPSDKGTDHLFTDTYGLGREDSFAGVRPQSDDKEYMRGYNEAQEDAGLPRMQPPSDSGRGKRLDPNKLKGAFAGKYYGSR